MIRFRQYNWMSVIKEGASFSDTSHCSQSVAIQLERYFRHIHNRQSQTLWSFSPPTTSNCWTYTRYLQRPSGIWYHRKRNCVPTNDCRSLLSRQLRRQSGHDNIRHMSHTVQPSRHVRRRCRSAYHLKRTETQNVFTFTQNQRSRKSAARKRSTRQKA